MAAICNNNKFLEVKREHAAIDKKMCNSQTRLIHTRKMGTRNWIKMSFLQ